MKQHFSAYLRDIFAAVLNPIVSGGRGLNSTQGGFRYEKQMEFVEAARESGARIIASSSLMTPTLIKMQDLENELRRAGLKGKIKTIIGGEATSREFAEKIGADAWGKEAVEGVEKIKELVVQMKRDCIEIA